MRQKTGAVAVQFDAGKPPSDEGGGFCEAKDGGRENERFTTPQSGCSPDSSPDKGSPWCGRRRGPLERQKTGAVGAAEDGGRENEGFTTPQSGCSPDSSPDTRPAGLCSEQPPQSGGS